MDPGVFAHYTIVCSADGGGEGEGGQRRQRIRSRTLTQSDNGAINLRRRARCLSYGHYLPATNRTLKLFVAGRAGAADFTLL